MCVGALSPSPTVAWSGEIAPLRTACSSAAMVTAPAVSVKIPSVRASSLMPSTTESSSTSSTVPPKPLTSPRAMASDLATVFGLTTSPPRTTVPATLPCSRSEG